MLGEGGEDSEDEDEERQERQQQRGRHRKVVRSVRLDERKLLLDSGNRCRRKRRGLQRMSGKQWDA